MCGSGKDSIHIIFYKSRGTGVGVTRSVRDLQEEVTKFY